MGDLNRRVAGAVISDPIYVKWKGATGTVYRFELDAIGVPYEARSGVYIFCHFGPLNRLVADHIEEADDFSRRIGADLTKHRQWKAIEAAGSTHICTLHVPGKAAERVRIEADLRRAEASRLAENAVAA
jgi:hypothetical protein